MMNRNKKRQALAHVKHCRRREVFEPPVCEIRASQKHGLGVFATRDIGPCELLTFYPADEVLWWPDYSETPAHALSTGLQLEALHELLDYSASVGECAGHPMEILGDPTNIEDPWFLGHMANDACQMTKPHQGEIYEKASEAGANAAICDYHMGHGSKKMGLFSRRPIQKGEEITVHYGRSYWERKVARDMPECSMDLNAMD